MKRCKRCLLPETVETICFDSDGVCNICNSVLVHKPSVDWDLRLSKLDSLVNNLKPGKRYDLLIPFSGGKDSTYQLYFMRKRYPNLKFLQSRLTIYFLDNLLSTIIHVLLLSLESTASLFHQIGILFVN